MKLLGIPLMGLALLTVAALAVAGCASGSTGLRPDAGGLQSSNAQPSGPVAPDFIVSTGAGSAFSLAEHRGEVVVLYFSFPG